MITIREHEKIPYDSLKYQEVWKEGMRLSGQSVGLERWFFQWQWRNPLANEEDDVEYSESNINESGYYTSYVIGAQWFDKEKKMPLVVTTKYGCDRIDFLKMFSTCFNSGVATEEFSRIYDVDINQPRIKCPELSSVLSPLIIAHFVSIVQEILKHGLKKDYVNRAENLKKVKGRIDIFKNERLNILPKRFDRVFCRYQEYSVNTPENRLLKRALHFALQILQVAGISRNLAPLQYTVQQYLSAFANVDEQIEVWEVKSIKHHKLFKEYDDAIRLAQMILLRYDFNITNITPAEEEYCPVFWLDMSMLYEHYVLGLLKEAYGNKIHYQAQGYTGYPDFVCYSPQIVMDTKYIPRFENNSIDTYIVRQLSGYSRDKKLFPNSPINNIPCVIIYPIEGEEENPFKNMVLEDTLVNEDRRLWNFYKVAVPLPVLNDANK